MTIGYLTKDQLEPSECLKAGRLKDLDKKHSEFIDLPIECYAGKSKFERMKITDPEDDEAEKKTEGEERGTNSDPLALDGFSFLL
mmetsp:Transcript_103021/g.330444  ORF Transcript_103021/g.330444 Transcript_103021/m.330444 type:complete len:85 (+) Transcript_103021:594-848(+)